MPSRGIIVIMKHEQLHVERIANGWSRARRLLGLAVVGSLASCTPSGPSDRNAPERDEYLIDSSDLHYERIRSVMQVAETEAVRGELQRLLESPYARWLTSESANVAELIKHDIAIAGQTGSIPTFVVYGIPDRDLGQESRGGLSGTAEYLDWTRVISETIDDNPAVLILEPDALPGVALMDEGAKDERIGQLRASLEIYQNNPNTAVYLDSGHSSWHSPELMADLIDQVDPDGDLISGISLNVSNQRPTEEIQRYADEIQEILGRELYVMVDVAMNGAEITAELEEWCNPVGERLGHMEDIVFDPNDRYEEMIIKDPGSSDGRCGTSDEPAGRFDPELLLRQAGQSE